MLVIDLASPGRELVVFLSDGGGQHGYWLGRDFEDWQWAMFVEDDRSGLVVDNAIADRWRP